MNYFLIVHENQSVREITHGSAEYWATVNLRDAVLRRPLGLQFSAQELEAENGSRHVACYRGERLVGCVIVRPLAGGDVRIRQLAVVAELQGQGIGTGLMEFAERLARKLGYRRILLHARETAVAFYERLGYAKVGEPFEEVTIRHWQMERRLEE